jgi:hypothetical protein
MNVIMAYFKEQYCGVTCKHVTILSPDIGDGGKLQEDSAQTEHP